jgi:hypothetical protein
MLAPLRRTGFTLFALLTAAGVLLHPASASAVIRNWNNAAGGSALHQTPADVRPPDNLIFRSRQRDDHVSSGHRRAVISHDYATRSTTLLRRDPLTSSNCCRAVQHPPSTSPAGSSDRPRSI